jgi:hypothetical protein
MASLLFGLIMFAYGIWPGQNQFVQGCAMILTLFGVVLMLCGWRIMQYAYFPIVYLICGIPLAAAGLFVHRQPAADAGGEGRGRDAPLHPA